MPAGFIENIFLQHFVVNQKAATPIASVKKAPAPQYFLLKLQAINLELY